jgi:hypothetical protein
MNNKGRDVLHLLWQIRQVKNDLPLRFWVVRDAHGSPVGAGISETDAWLHWIGSMTVQPGEDADKVFDREIDLLKSEGWTCEEAVDAIEYERVKVKAHEAWSSY